MEKIHTYDIGYNLFNYAYKELSQDAVICWLIKWAYYDEPIIISSIYGPRYDRLRKCGKDFVEALFAKHGNKVPHNPKVEIWQQDNNIDVLARIGEYVLLIEDKKGTGDHSDQLERYYQLVLDGETVAGEVAGEEFIIPIYLKTENLSLYDVLRIENSTKYKVFDRSDFLDIVYPYDTAHPIVYDFSNYLKFNEEDTQSYKEWREDGKVEESYRSWQGFYRELENHLVVFDKDNDLIGFDEIRNTKYSLLENNWKRNWPENNSWGWGWVPNKAGGFAGFWWYSKTVKSCGHDVEIYLQLEIKLEKKDDRKLCFKVFMDEADKDIKWDCHLRILKAGESLVRKPKRIGHGKAVTIAEWKDPWLVFKPNGGLDIPETVKNLMKAQSVLDKVDGLMC